MKNYRQINRMLLTSLLIASQLSLPIISAQSVDATVNYSVNVKLNQTGQPATEMTNLRYDVINLDTKEVVWSYRNGEKTSDVLALSEGNFVLRIYDWTTVEQSGAIIADELLQSIAEPTAEELQNNQQDRKEYLPGEVVTLGDGSVVYDVSFQVKASDYLLDTATNTYQGDLTLFLADPVTAQANDEVATDDTVSEATEVPAETTAISEETEMPQVNASTLELSVTDSDGNAVGNVTVEFAGQVLPTDEAGVVRFEQLAAGLYTLVVTTPAGYETFVNQEIEIPENTVTQVALELTKLPVAPATMTGTVVVTDETGIAVQGATVLIDGIESKTNEQGIATFAEMPAGEYLVEVVGAPSEYDPTGQTILVVDTANQSAQATIQLAKVNQVGSLTFIAKDNNGQPVENVGILFNDQLIYTLADGTVTVNSLPLGEYQYELAEIPTQYETSATTGSASVIEANQTVEVPIALNAVPQVQKVSLTIVDQLGQPVSDAVVTLNNQQQTSDAEGRVYFEQVPVGDVTYTITQLPKLFNAQYEGSVAVTADSAVDEKITLERAIKKGTATLTVVNQDNEPLSDVTLKFGGLTGVTDSNGQVVFESLELGNYHYQAIEAPQNISLDVPEKVAEITEGIQFTDTIQLQQAKVGSVALVIQDASGKVYPNVSVTLNGETKMSDEKGRIIFNNVPQGDVDVQITATDMITFANAVQKVTVKAGEEQSIVVTGEAVVVTTTQATTTTVTQAPETTQPATTQTTTSITTQATTTQIAETTQPTSTESSTQATTVETTTVAPITGEQSLKQFVDATTNIELWVHPDDANKVAKFTATRLTNGLPNALAKKELDAYQLSVVDQNGQPVQFTKTIQLKFPSRPVNAQIQVVRFNGEQITAINNTLVNQRANIITQQLGNFAIIYGDKVEATTETTQAPATTTQSVAVSTQTSVEKRLIPATGEASNVLLRTVAVTITALLGVALIKRRR